MADARELIEKARSVIGFGLVRQTMLALANVLEQALADLESCRKELAEARLDIREWNELDARCGKELADMGILRTESLWDQLIGLVDREYDAREENARLRSALEFYAEPRCYHCCADNGQRAREALKPEAGEGEDGK